MAPDGGPTTSAPGRPGVVARYYLYRATATVGFITPVFTLFMRARELTWSQIATLSAVVWVLVLVGEVPTGYVGDRIGRRNGLLASTLATVASLVGFVFADSFGAFVVLYSLWALGMTFRSGTESAWLYEVLRARSRAGEFTRVRGRGESVNRWTGAAAMVVGGVLFVVDPVFPFVVAAGWHGVGIVVLFGLPSSPEYRPGQSGPGDPEAAPGDPTDADRSVDAPTGPDGSESPDATGGPAVGEAVGIVRRALLEPPLRSFVLYVGLLFGAVGAANTYVQPIAVEAVRSSLSALSVSAPGSVEATLGLLYAGFTAVAAVASYHAGAVEDRFGADRTILWVVPLVGAILVIPVVAPVLAIPAFFAMRGADPLVRPMVTRRLNESVDSAGRATVLSAASMAYAVVRIPLVLGGGVLADATAPLVAVAAFGGVVLAVGAVVVAVERPAAGDHGVERSPAPDR